MGFLTGKTVIVTGGGRAVLSDGRCVRSVTVSLQHMQKKAQMS